MSDHLKQFVTQYISGAQGCEMDCDTAQTLAEEIAALQARVAELEALVKDDEEQAKWVEGLTDDWIAAEARADAAEAMLSEAVKAGMLEGSEIIQPKWERPDVDPSNMGDVQDEAFWLADMNASTRLRALADDPETIARIVAQLKEGRG